MPRQHDELLLQDQQLRERVDETTSNKTGRLADQSLDLDARAMAIIGKRQQLNVCLSAQQFFKLVW